MKSKPLLALFGLSAFAAAHAAPLGTKADLSYRSLALPASYVVQSAPLSGSSSLPSPNGKVLRRQDSGGETPPSDWGVGYAWSLKKHEYALLNYRVDGGSTDLPIVGRTNFDVNLSVGMDVNTKATVTGAGVGVRWTKHSFYLAVGAGVVSIAGKLTDVIGTATVGVALGTG